MKKNSKKLIFIFFCFLIFLIANAQDTAEQVLDSFVSQVLQPVVCSVIVPLVDMILIPLCLVFLAISGIKILAAGGDPGKIKSEKDRIMMIVTALFIVFAFRSFLIGAINFLASGSTTEGIKGILDCLYSSQQ